MYIEEDGVTCADATPFVFWEYPALISKLDKCTHKIEYSSDETIVNICKALLTKIICLSNINYINCLFVERCNISLSEVDDIIITE